MPLNRVMETPHKDHCHIMGKYREPAHNSCNLKYQTPRHILVFMNNLLAYDAHFINEPLAKFNWKNSYHHDKLST